MIALRLLGTVCSSVVILLSLVACGGATGAGETLTAERLTDGAVTETVVDVIDGLAGPEVHLVSVTRLSPDARAARVDAQMRFLAGGSVAEEGCVGTPLWLFDQPNQRGNIVCLRSEGNFDLDQVALRCIGSTGDLAYCGTWAGRVRSVWTAAQVAAYVYVAPGWLDCSVAAPESQQDVPASGQNMVKLYR
jgi:hypothetical protein